MHIQAIKEIIVGTSVKLSQLDDDAGTDIQFTGFIFGIGRPSDVAAPALKLRANLFLGQPALGAEPAQIFSHVPIPSDFLFHGVTSVFSDQYWLQLPIFYVIVTVVIDRDTGQLRNFE
jgi:hypothetical protein